MHNSLTEVTTKEQISKVKAFAENHLEMIYVPFSLRTELENFFPESPVRVFVFPNVQKPEVIFLFKDNLHIKPTVILAPLLCSSVPRRQLLDLMKEFRHIVFGNRNQTHLVVAVERFSKMYEFVMRNNRDDWISESLRLSLFYMSDSQKKLAVVAPLPKLPYGYFYDELEPTEEADQVNSTWAHAGPGDLEQTMAKLDHLPSSCVRFDGQAVAFEMVDPSGFLNNQFVYEEHRRKGLGNAVEIDVLKKCIADGMNPFKTVALNNQVVLDASIASKYWTQYKDDKGRPNTIVFQTWKIRDNL